jgi:uncharacterized protein YcnI
MKKFSMLSILFIFIATTAFADVPRTLNPSKEKEIKARMEVLQVPFIKNESQISDVRVKYYANTFAGTVFVRDSEIVYGLKGQTIKEKLLKAKKTKAEGIKETVTKINYFKGNDQSKWKSNIPTYQEISLGEVYDRIQLSLKAYGKNVEKIFVVEPGGKPGDIAIKVEGGKGLNVNEKGELEIDTGLGKVKMTTPIAYQEIGGKRIKIPILYTLLNAKHVYGFRVGDYNKTRELVIDPLLASTYLGGSRNDFTNSMALDSSGNVYVGADRVNSLSLTKLQILSGI